MMVRAKPRGQGGQSGKMKSHVSQHPALWALQTCSASQPWEMRTQLEQGQQRSAPGATRKPSWEELVLNEAMAPGTAIAEP